MVIIHNARDGLSLHFFANLRRYIEDGLHEQIGSSMFDMIGRFLLTTRNCVTAIFIIIIIIENSGKE